jgi:hypothetical protein
MRRIFNGRAGTALAFILGAMIATAGTATAAKLITGKQIKDGSISSKDLSKSVRAQLKKTGPSGPAGPAGPAGAQGAKGDPGTNVDKCPADAPTNLGGLCYGAAVAGTDWDTAVLGCAALKLRVPSIVEALLVVNAAGGETWTDEVTGAGTRGLVKALPAPQILQAAQAGPHTYRCITNATS